MIFNKAVLPIALSLMLVLAVPAARAAEKDGGSDSKKTSILEIGIKGGMDFTSLARYEPGYISESVSTYTGFSAGVTFSIDLPVRGMTLQPELNYVSKGAAIRGDIGRTLRFDYIELPVNLQAGLDLIFLRPFICLSPYIGCAVYKQVDEIPWKYFNRFEYGIGIGGGIDIWRFQLQVKYNWNLGPLAKDLPEGIVGKEMEDVMDFVGAGNYRGLEVSLTFFF
ncbi:MAG TPA: outer membrane beta-barrel protein [Candidatus Coprenecus stercoripullorum]|nr:outer membrane beta-barrel protein [Candidatus Coprenecus stercoripullorum]